MEIKIKTTTRSIEARETTKSIFDAS